jgi:hypothetical protein
MELDTKTYWLTDWPTVSRNVTSTLIGRESSEVQKWRQEYDSTRNNRTRENSRRPEAQDTDNSEGFVIQKELNVWIIITECNCESDIK